MQALTHGQDSVVSVSTTVQGKVREPKRPVLQPVEIVESWPLERYHSPIILCLKGGEDDVTAAKQKTLKSKNR
jgi:hypothetical protein